MKKIKFSHNYYKLHGQTKAELLAVKELKIDENTPKALIDYDTSFENGKYPLSKGDYVQLVFLGNFGIPFCTIRRKIGMRGYNKLEYYTPLIGETFDVEVENSKNDMKELLGL